MSRGVNKVIIIGNLGSKPEIRYMPNGSSITSISVATSESWKDRQTNEKKTRTEWHKIKLFNKLGEVANRYLKKGSKVYIEGSLKSNKWKDQNEVDRYSVDIIANNIQMLDAKSSPEDHANNFIAEKNLDSNKSRDISTEKDRLFEDDIPF